MNNFRTVAFVCQHASAKSLIAAQYLNSLAREGSRLDGYDVGTGT